MRSLRMLLPVLGLLAATSVRPSVAQDLAEIRLDRAGTLVRVYASLGAAPPIEGRVEGLSDGGLLVIRADQDGDVTVPRGTIERIEFSTGRRGHPWWGAVAGALVTGIPAALYWNRECEGSCRTPALEGFAMGSLYYGLLPGFVIGSLIRTREWRPLPLIYLDSAVGRRQGPRFDLQLAPGPTGGFSLGLRLSIDTSVAHLRLTAR